LADEEVFCLGVGMAQARSGRIGSKQVALKVEAHISDFGAGTRKSRLRRVGRMDTVELFTVAIEGIGIEEVTNESVLPAGFRS